MKLLNSFKSEIIFLFIILGFTSSFFSCKKDSNIDGNDKGKVSFSFHNKDAGMLKSSSINAYSIDSVVRIVVSIKDKDNNFIYQYEVLKLLKIGTGYISSTLSLTPGNYKLSAFLLVDRSNNVLFLTPKKGSKYASLVNMPLEIDFAISKDMTTQLEPEVISSEDQEPDAFGYASFNFLPIKTFYLYTSSFISNGSSINYISSFLTVVQRGDTIFRDSLYAIPNKIRLPERNGDYKFIIAKDGYPNLSETFTIDSLKLHSGINNPLIFTFYKSMAHGLVFWNKLGSAEEILHSVVGPNLSFYDPAIDGTTPCCDVTGVPAYVPGKFGNALTVGPSDNYYPFLRVHMITLRDEDAVIDYNHGCIEVWYYQKEDPLANSHWNRIWNGAFGLDANLGFYAADPSETGFLFTFSMRTDLSNGISINYNPGNGIRNNHNLNNRWIHLAIVWDKAGIDKSDNTMEMFVDGKMVASGKQNNWSKVVNGSQDISGGVDHNIANSFFMDNLKVWNYAKTDFSDRFSE